MTWGCASTSVTMALGALMLQNTHGASQWYIPTGFMKSMCPSVNAVNLEVITMAFKFYDRHGSRSQFLSPEQHLPSTFWTHSIISLYKARQPLGTSTMLFFIKPIMLVSILPPYVIILCRLDNIPNVYPPRFQKRYSEFLRVMRWWRHLKMLKRAGRGQVPDGPDSTPPGGLALECPACS